MRKTINSLVGLVLGAIIGGTLVWAFTPDTVTAHAPIVDDRVVIVPCPSEDSCTVDYYDGAWHIGPAGSAE